MRHAEVLTDRILFLEGLPNYQKLFALRIGETVKEQFDCDMKIEREAVDRLRTGAAYMRSIGDITSAKIFEDILADEEHHIDYLETQLHLIEKIRRGALPAERLGAPGGRLTRDGRGSLVEGARPRLTVPPRPARPRRSAGHRSAGRCRRPGRRRPGPAADPE